MSRTGDKKIYNHCELCKYFRCEVRQGGGWLEICEATGERVIWGDGRLNKSNNCPLMELVEVEDE